ncbi:MAG: ABC transporter ATP-binding protein [Firmicutes bacterium]|nr:ABC transporter ATP-binding protein [Bacillota bacterium]MCL1953585.1 ABC transporter ATP-binding protein [Bacillota bacterium]
MDENVIVVDNLTKDYGLGRGCFDVSFGVKKGEVFGFLGPNGAGKSTTIRHLLGFQKAHKGNCSIMGLDCWTKPKEVQGYLGYIAGEINYPDIKTGWQFIKMIASMRGVDLKEAERLCEYYQLKPHGVLKRMSKGMKQKIALVVAFMHNPQIVILDEPTSGLDPLMQAKFVDHILSERDKGKTILMSSHIFEEVEKTCDRLAIIRNGKIVAQMHMNDITHNKDKQFEVRFKSLADAQTFGNLQYEFVEKNYDKSRVKVKVHDSHINRFVADLAKYQLEYISEIKLTLEERFMEYYKDDTMVGGSL